MHHHSDAGPVPDTDARLWMENAAFYLYWDDINGKWLDPDKARAARKEELE